MTNVSSPLAYFNEIGSCKRVMVLAGGTLEGVAEVLKVCIYHYMPTSYVSVKIS